MIMSWKYCEKRFIRKVKIDSERVESIIDKAKKRLIRSKNTELNLEMVSFIVEDYYEVIKELLIAYLLKNGLRSKNHQCLISYFYRENPSLESEVFLIQQMSYFRNRLSYYGEEIPMKFYTKNKKDFERIIKIILELLK
jgi:uncharacterized protein (UPF0332 family)